MAITTAMCDQAKLAFLSGAHLPAHNYKIALIKSVHTGTYGANTYSYNEMTGDEVPNGSGYVTGGYILSGSTYALVAGTATLDFADKTWTNSTIASSGAMIYNDSLAAKPAIAVFSFGAEIKSTNGDFLVQIPTGGVGQVIKIG